MGIALIVKKGHQHNPINENLAIKEGMISDFFSTDSPDFLNLSPHMKKVYATIILDDSYLEDIKSWTMPIFDAQGNVIRKRPYVLDLPSFCQRSGDSTLYTRLGDSSIVEPIHTAGMGDIRSLFKEAALTDYNHEPDILDVNAISSGSYDIGSGGDYATWLSWEADWATLTGLMTGTQISAFTMNTDCIFNGATGGFNFELLTDTHHDGDPTQGWITTLSSGGTQNLRFQHTGGGIAKSDGLYLKKGSASGGVNANSVNTSGCLSPIEIKNILIDGAEMVGRGINGGISSSTLKLNNFKIWGFPNYGLGGGSGLTAENGFIYDCDTAGIDGASAACTIRNVGCWTNGTNFTNIGSATGENNASDTTSGQDADWSTGTDNEPSLTAVDEIESFSDVSSDFGKFKAGGVISTAGKLPTNATEDIAGITYGTPSAINPHTPLPSGGGLVNTPLVLGHKLVNGILVG